MLDEHRDIAGQVIAASLAVRREMGPGLLDSACEGALAHELTLGGTGFESQKELPVRDKALVIDGGYRLDFLVRGAVEMEFKAVEPLPPIDETQLLTYLKLSGCRVGLLVNFNTRLLKNGIKRLVN
jgi:GxxExxY protein